jgi:uncharacterized membrane-anchored protein
MDKIRVRLVIGVIILQMAFFAGWYINESKSIESPTVKKIAKIIGKSDSNKITQIMVRTLAHDPRDLISGQYIRLGYEFSRLDKQWYKRFAKGLNAAKSNNVWVVLHEVDGFYELNAAFSSKPKTIPEGNVLIKGTMGRGNNIQYGIEKYFVSEGTAEPNSSALTVKLDVYENGKTRISQVFLDGKIWS